jgi:predicted proteasome-type protease
MMAYSNFGNSQNITVQTFTTKPLSNAVKLNLVAIDSVITNAVTIIKALTDVLQIDPNRIKLVSSYKFAA